MDRSADERPPGEREGQRAQSAGNCHQSYDSQPSSPARSSEATFDPCRAERIAKPRRRAKNEALETAAADDVNADDRGETPSAQPLNRCADQAAAGSSAGDQSEPSIRTRNGLCDRDSGSDASATQRARAESNNPKDGDDGDGR
jgi:hypothetical protein